MGQEARELGQRIGIPGGAGRPHHCNTEAVSSEIYQCNGTVLPYCKLLLSSIEVQLNRLQIPDRWMKQKDTPEEDPNCLVELWPDW
jgi:1-phosphatidylinositol-3-phosphate 5-kinase